MKYQMQEEHGRRGPAMSKRVVIFLAVGVVLSLIGVALIIAALVLRGASCEHEAPTETSAGPHVDNRCLYSAEAKRVNLDSFLAEVKTTYYQMRPNEIVYDPDTTDSQAIGQRFRPYDARPEAIKKRTDKARALYARAKSIADKAKQAKLKPRELKALAQVQHFLQSNFGAPYDENYYAGDWMLGPNKFCWQPICSVGYDLKTHYPADRSYGFHPESVEDLDTALTQLKATGDSVTEYINNVALGVKAGFIRSVEECQDGLYSIQRRFPNIYREGPRGVLNESFVKGMRDPRWLWKPEKWAKRWQDDKGLSVQESVDAALLENIGTPIHNMLSYLEFNHSLHCVPSNVSSGLATLPLPEIYWNGTSTGEKTTGVLPTGEKLSGKRAYEMILPYFTTNDMTPDEVYDLGQTMLNKLYPEAVQIAMNYTRESNSTRAVEKFKSELAAQKMFFNDMKIPENESNKEAFSKCTSLETAKVHCPMRYKAMMAWFKEVNEILSVLAPKTTHMFHFTSDKQTTPNCPVKLVANFNPGTGSQSYSASGKSCPRAGHYRLPFYLKDLGPRYNAISVAAHEARPGHHTQVQGFRELFGDSCGGVISWLNGASYYTAFTEGWALYAENPLIAQETDTYKDEPLQRYGMLKWQIWRALRLMMDTGLHYKGMKRYEAINLFEDKAWDSTDKAVKDVTRYQSDPGQATAYMIGQLAIWKIRNDTKSKLEKAGKTFNEKDFHYHILSQGSSPLSFLSSYMERYSDCVIDPDGDGCEDVTGPIPGGQAAEAIASQDERPWQPRPYDEHYE